ncbi:NAD(P)H-dependent oxidoreductase [Streptomyces sp. ADMS]|uniref:NAD(P)H-dependent oxidoreductase n=1 Tax=Streptomyces sp. ADMS TaxID=3071415 RepID=UPI00296E45C4|nr:NAD(P)H-dependent oxidoreductase [Streptomyces sp. ADMS]MDW4905275.1 NAD(P)H-dependent oxidoreductase [Streptomyces sp. ADMS]
MNVLIVFAHPELCSFNGALKVRAVDVLKQAGHEVVVSDLYRLGWKAAVDADDFPGVWTDPDFLDVAAEQERVSAAHETPPDVHAEQEKVARCDLMILQFPLWWSGMPAILKGWVDRTMARGFAYGRGRAYDTGPIRGRRALVCTTTGTPSGLYAPDGTDDDLDRALWPIHHGILGCLGFDVLPPFVARTPGEVSAKQREEYLTEYGERLLAVSGTEPL